MTVKLAPGGHLADFQDDRAQPFRRKSPAFVQLADGRVWWVEEYFNTSASSITAGDWVELDETDTDYPGKAVQQGTNADARIVGLALETGAASEWFPVLRQGVLNYDVDGIRAKMTNTTVVGPVQPAASGGSEAYTGDGPIIGYNLEAAGASGADLVEVRCLTVQQQALGIGSLAAAAYFVSTEQTGTGSSQNVAHGLGSTPTKVLISVTELPDAAAETGFDVAEGSHDSTNVVVTVTNTVKFKVLAFK